MSRKKFIESNGATCNNWRNSWSFVNESEKVIIFGAWDRFAKGNMSLIFREKWKFGASGRKSSAYPQSREHTRLLEDSGYKLKTFPLKYSDAKVDADGIGPATIGGFEKTLTDKSLVRVGTIWYASDGESSAHLAEELDHSNSFNEGGKKRISINAYERNTHARRACIDYHGTVCKACGFDFSEKYGELGSGFIHVHHVNPISQSGDEYELDPVSDLVPVCPNCHAMIHRTQPPLTVLELSNHLKSQTNLGNI